MAFSTAPHNSEVAGALTERLVSAAAETMNLACIHIGRELGLYEELRDSGPLTAPQLAERTGTDERYVREWLEQQAVASVIDVHDTTVAAHERRYAISSAHAEVLIDPTSPYLASPFARYMVGIIKPIDHTIAAFRTGAGVSYDLFPEARIAQAESNRPVFANDLGEKWIPALPEVHQKFTQRGGRVADIACGAGWSSIEIARAYPLVKVDGYDLDPESIRLARQNLAGSGAEEHVRFFEQGGADADADTSYDLVTIFEAVHDMARPVEVLATARQLVGTGGLVLVADEKAQPEFVAPGDELEQLFYGFSVLFCLPTGRDGDDSVATGTAMRPRTLDAYAKAAGYRATEILPVDNDVWRFYLLVP